MSAQPARLHVALNVSDLDRSIRFYADVLGVEPDKEKPGYARFVLDSPAIVLSLNAGEAVRSGNRLSHLGVRLGGGQSLDPLRERLVAKGHLRLEEHETNCCHAIQNKLWVADPDGNEWEFYELVDDDPDGTSRAPAAEAEAGGRASDCC